MRWCNSVRSMFRCNMALVMLGLLAACASLAPPPTPKPVVASLTQPPPAVATVVSQPSRPTETRAAASVATSTAAPPPTGTRRPRGIYAVVDLEFAKTLQNANPAITPSELHTYFNKLYTAVLTNPAVSGLTIQVGWSRLNPNPASDAQAYEWSLLDDAFSSVDMWNGLNPSLAPKTIQVQVFAGFFTPPWVLDQIPSCDSLFMSPPQTPPQECGKATFAGFR